MPSLEVMADGALTLIQDIGRYGGAEHGLSQGGAIDLQAFCWANKLLGNAINAPQLEIVLGQAKFKALDHCECALTGADMDATIDGHPVAPWQTFTLVPGQILQLGIARKGIRAYLAIRGGFKASSVLGSVSTVVRNKIGGTDCGNPIKTGQVLSSTAIKRQDRFQSVPPRYIPDYDKDIQLHVIESYQCKQFTSQQKKRFYGSGYQLTPQADRMGYRLQGEPITSNVNTLISQPIAYGAIQFPPDGQPIILLNDRQTLGGYPILGCIARMDISRLAQAKPGDQILFQSVNTGQFEELQQQWLSFCRFFALPL